MALDALAATAGGDLTLRAELWDAASETGVAMTAASRRKEDLRP